MHLSRFAIELFVVGLIYYLITAFSNAKPPIWTIAIMLVAADNAVGWIRGRFPIPKAADCAACGAPSLASKDVAT